MTSLQHKDLPARLRQIAGTGQPIVPRPDNHDIVMRHAAVVAGRDPGGTPLITPDKVLARRYTGA